MEDEPQESNQLQNSPVWQKPPNQEDIASPSPTENEIAQSQPGNRNKKKIVILFATFLVFLFLIISAGLALAYTNYNLVTPPKFVTRLLDSLIISTPLPKTPRLVLTQTQKEMSQLKTATVETVLQFSTTASEIPIRSAKIAIKGPVDFKTAGGTNSEFSVLTEIAMEGLKITLAGQVKKIQDNLYLKLTEFPGGGFLPSGKIKNQWFVINLQEQIKDSDELEALTSQDQEKVGEIKKILEDFISQSHNWSEFTKGNNKENYSLKIKPPKEELDNLFFKIIEILEPKNQSQLKTSLERENLEKLTKNLENIEINLEIKKANYLIEKGSLSYNLNLEKSSNFLPIDTATLSPVNSIPLTFSVTVNLSGFNIPVVIEEPQNAQDLTKTFENLLKLPQSATPPAILEPEPPSSGFRELLQNPSNVLGAELKYWDLYLLETTKKFFNIF